MYYIRLKTNSILRGGGDIENMGDIFYNAMGNTPVSSAPNIENSVVIVPF